MRTDQLYRLIDLETDHDVGSFEKLSQAQRRVRRHGLRAYAIWQGQHLVCSCDPDGDVDDDMPMRRVADRRGVEARA